MKIKESENSLQTIRDKNVSLPQKTRLLYAIQKKSIYLRSLIIDEYEVSRTRKKAQKDRMLSDG